MVKAKLKKASGKARGLNGLPSTFKLANRSVRDRVYRIANYIGFKCTYSSWAPSMTVAPQNGTQQGDKFMQCGWPLHLAHNPDLQSNLLADRMKTYGEVRPLEIGLMHINDSINPNAARVGHHNTVYLLDMEKPPFNAHYTNEIPAPRFSDVGLGPHRSLCQLKMEKVTQVLEFGVQPFSLNTVAYADGQDLIDPSTAAQNVNAMFQVGAKMFRDPAVTRNWTDEVRVVSLCVHSDGELCDFPWDMRDNGSASASKRWIAERFFDFDSQPARTAYGEQGARLDFYAPVTGRYKTLFQDEGCSEAFWQVDVLHDQVYRVGSSPQFIQASLECAPALDSTGEHTAVDAVPGDGGPDYQIYTGRNGFPDSNQATLSLQKQVWARPIVPAGDSTIISIEYPMGHALWYSDQVTGETIVAGNTVAVESTQVLHCENMQIFTFIFSKNSIARPIATRGTLWSLGVPGHLGPQNINSENLEEAGFDHAGDAGTVAAFFVGKVVKEFSVPDKI